MNEKGKDSLPHLVQLWVEGVGLHVHDVHSVRPQSRNNQPSS